MATVRPSLRPTMAADTAAAATRIAALRQEQACPPDSGGIKVVPESRLLREQLRGWCRDTAAAMDRSRPLTKDRLETAAQRLLADRKLPEAYLGWTMVVLASEFWRNQVASIPRNRRLLLLPGGLAHAETCAHAPAGRDRRKCDACAIAAWRKRRTAGLQGSDGRKLAARAQLDCQRARGCDRRCRLPERARKGNRQDSELGHSLHGGPAAQS